MEMDATEILIRFIITFALSLLFGIERQRSHKPIGFGTYIFVAVGSCGLAIVSIIIDVLNILSAIVTGIGFLGAGALIKTGDKIFGFTSAACIWIFAIFGVIIGVGEYYVGLIMYIFIWVVIGIDKIFEKKNLGSYQKKLNIVANREIIKDDFRSILGIKRYKVVSVDVNKKTNLFSFTILIEGTKSSINHIPDILHNIEWIDSFSME